VASVTQWGAYHQNRYIYSAMTSAYGSAHADGPLNSAYASSRVRTHVYGSWSGWRTGRMGWNFIGSDRVSGLTSAMGTVRRVRNYDPITFDLLDADGASLASGTLLSISLTGNDLSAASDDETDSSLGDFDNLQWDENGLVSDGVRDMLLTILIDSPYVVEAGSLTLKIEDGLVTESESTGLFASILLPTIGTDTLGGLSIPTLINNFELEYDFSSFGGDVDQIKFGLDGGGAAMVVPEPFTMALVMFGVATIVSRRRR
jgi:hypothetical protein